MQGQLIPLSDAAKARADIVAIPTGVFAYFKAIPWPEIAGALAALYTALRIGELIWGWLKKK